jgi:hypothetical protein
MGRHARVRVAGLVAKSPVEKMLARLGRHMGAQNKLTRVHTELLLRSQLQGIVGTRRKVDRSDGETPLLDHRQPGRNQGLLQGCMRVDVQAVRLPGSVDRSGPNDALEWSPVRDRGTGPQPLDQLAGSRRRAAAAAGS